MPAASPQVCQHDNLRAALFGKCEPLGLGAFERLKSLETTQQGCIKPLRVIACPGGVEIGSTGFYNVSDGLL
jgi:hypothetical protein